MWFYLHFDDLFGNSFWISDGINKVIIWIEKVIQGKLLLPSQKRISSANCLGQKTSKFIYSVLWKLLFFWHPPLNEKVEVFRHFIMKFLEFQILRIPDFKNSYLNPPCGHPLTLLFLCVLLIPGVILKFVCFFALSGKHETNIYFGKWWYFLLDFFALFLFCCIVVSYSGIKKNTWMWYR